MTMHRPSSGGTRPPLIANPSANSATNFVNQLTKYTTLDIKKLEDVGHEAEIADSKRGSNDPLFGTGRCATALLSLCFATIEEIGLILIPNLCTMAEGEFGEYIKGKGTSKANEFFSFVKKLGVTEISKDEIEALYKIFRNKVTHNLLPRFNVGIKLDSKNGIKDLIISEDGGFKSLNVNFLSNAVTQAIKELNDTVTNTTYGKLDIANLINLNYQKIIQFERQKIINLTNVPQKNLIKKWVNDDTL